MSRSKCTVDLELLTELVQAGHEAAGALCKSLDLDLAVGNDDDFEDIKEMTTALDRLSAALEKVKQSGVL